MWKRFYAAHETRLSVHRKRLPKGIAAKYFIAYFGEHRVANMPDTFVEKYCFAIAGTPISFRLGAEDAACVGCEFEPVFLGEDFIRLPNSRIQLRLMIEGEPSKPFRAITLRASD